MNEGTKPPSPTPVPVILKRAEDFSSLYANNVRFESSIWGLRMVFGELDQSAEEGKQVVEFHTAISVPWIQVKLMIFYLQCHLISHELETEKVKVPGGVVPPELPVLTKEQENNPILKATLEQYRKIRDEFIAANK